MRRHCRNSALAESNKSVEELVRFQRNLAQHLYECKKRLKGRTRIEGNALPPVCDISDKDYAAFKSWKNGTINNFLS